MHFTLWEDIVSWYSMTRNKESVLFNLNSVIAHKDIAGIFYKDQCVS